MRAEPESATPSSPVIQGNRAIFRYVGPDAREVSLTADSTDWKPLPLQSDRRGWSLGGLIASYGALSRPDAFRLVGAQSPAYRVVGDLPGWLASFDAIDWSGLRVHVDGGTFETVLHGMEYLPDIRRGAVLLREKGAAVQYNEVNEGHNWTNWRGRLPDLLTWLLGPTAQSHRERRG